MDYAKQNFNIVNREQREELLSQKSIVLWFTGLSGSGKTTIARRVEHKLNELGYLTFALDGDTIRNGINKDLGFSNYDRTVNIGRVAEITKLFLDCGVIVLASFISPFEKDRQNVKALLGAENFVEIFVDTPLQECERRDVKGLYEKARSGQISAFTGISSPYEIPQNSDLTIDTIDVTEDEAANLVLSIISERISLPC